jgi:hypothetical protein
MQKVEDLRSGWEREQASAKAEKEKQVQKSKSPAADDMIVPDDVTIEEETEAAPSGAALFDDSDDSDAEEHGESDKPAVSAEVGGISIDKDDATEEAAKTTQQDLFGDSEDDESDEELKRSRGKRGGDEKDQDADGAEEPPSKKSKVNENSD